MLRETHINIWSKIIISQFSCTDVINYESPSSGSTIVYLSWLLHSEDVLGGKFYASEHENCGCWYVRKHREIKNGNNYIILDISLKFDNMDKIKITPSEPKYYLVKSGKGFITSLGSKAIRRSKYSKGKIFHYWSQS